MPVFYSFPALGQLPGFQTAHQFPFPALLHSLWQKGNDCMSTYLLFAPFLTQYIDYLHISIPSSEKIFFVAEPQLHRYQLSCVDYQLCSRL